ncbi:MAG: hypothetical protein QXU92_01595 [Candidatus Diapherotrites archaeon]
MELKKSPVRTAVNYFAALQKRYPYHPGERGIRTEQDENNFQIQKVKMAKHLLKLNLVPCIKQQNKRKAIKAIETLIDDETKILTSKQIPQEVLEVFKEIGKEKIESIIKQLETYEKPLQGKEITTAKEHTLIHGATSALLLLRIIKAKIKN